MKEGALDFLAKPVDPITAAARFARALERRGSEREPPHEGGAGGAAARRNWSATTRRAWKIFSSLQRAASQIRPFSSREKAAARNYSPARCTR
jgi:DNA-binding NtrC family response regulator